MPHYTPLIGTIVIGLVIAFLMGAIAHRLRLSPIIGYLAAGVLVGPFTPGYVADASLANELAELGVILLMFGVGLHFSLKDLLSVRRIAIPGALGQIAVATAMGMGLAHLLGWSVIAGLVFGLALSVASTVVLLRALQSRDILDTTRGRIAVGWLIVEDLAMVLALVLLPVLAQVMTSADAGGIRALAVPLLTTFAKVAGFVALMLIVGRRVIPWTLHWVVNQGSRELFRLAVLAIALGVAFGAAFTFGVSFALGAFFAGMILGETSLSRQAAEETLPLRDAFAVLFFVSVGMLFDPAVVVEQPLALLATVGIIVIGKSLAAFAIVRAFGHPGRTAFTVAASLAQIGEFSFILATLGTGLGVLPSEARDLILAGAILSIFVNPFIFGLVPARGTAAGEAQESDAAPAGHVILVGYGRVGSRIARALIASGTPYVVIEDQTDTADQAEADGARVIRGNAADPHMLELAGVASAARLLVAIPHGFEAGAVFEQARRLNPQIAVAARAHSDDAVAHLERLGVPVVIMGEREVATRMAALATTEAEPVPG